MRKMQGVIIAGGTGSRLYPMTRIYNKHLLPVYDKPMIFYPISVLMLAGIRDIFLVIKNTEHNNYYKILGNGKEYGINIEYVYQNEARGVADALAQCEERIFGKFVVILGDNFFFGQSLSNILKEELEKYTGGLTMFSVYGDNQKAATSAIFDEKGNVKELQFKSNEKQSKNICPGLYIYDEIVFKYIKELSPSQRGEIEIVDLNKIYLLRNRLRLKHLGRGIIWMDLGTNEARIKAENLIEQIQTTQGFFVACLEEIAYRNNWLKQEEISFKMSTMCECKYKQYLSMILNGDI